MVGRIGLIGYKRKEAKDLPYPSPLSPAVRIYSDSLRFECSLDLKLGFYPCLVQFLVNHLRPFDKRDFGSRLTNLSKDFF
jgi:hypothetical protein